MNPIGNIWLVKHYGLKVRPLTHRSFLGTAMERRELGNGVVEEYYIHSYDPGVLPLDHLQFALKYDDLDLDLLKKVLSRIAPQEVADFIGKRPSGKFARQVGFWYEELMEQEVPLKHPIRGNYESLLPEERYITAHNVIKNSRWRINNNLMGGRQFLPLIRRTVGVRAIEQTDWQGMLAEILRPFSEEILCRAFSYLYFKETKSSFAIEREEPGALRVEKFVVLLHHAGEEEFPLSEEVLTRLQNAIVEERYREKGFRSNQNYIGQTKAYFREVVHSAGIPPEFLKNIMQGLVHCFERSVGVSPILRAAAISFPFVFIHPFEDGNGRLHRYLIHDLLARGNLGGHGVILPVSAEILLNYRLYDACLEQFSKPLMTTLDYTLNQQGELEVHNASEVEGFYRYPDVTAAVEFLGQMIEKTIRETIPQEINFLAKFDQARQAINEIIDMPDRKRESLLLRLKNNEGKLGLKRREREFPELTDREIADIENAYQMIFS